MVEILVAGRGEKKTECLRVGCFEHAQQEPNSHHAAPALGCGLHGRNDTPGFAVRTLCKLHAMSLTKKTPRFRRRRVAERSSITVG